MAACGRVVGVVAGVEELGVWRRLIVGAVRDRPSHKLTRPFHPVNCRAVSSKCAGQFGRVVGRLVQFTVFGKCRKLP